MSRQATADKTTKAEQQPERSDYQAENQAAEEAARKRAKELDPEEVRDCNQPA